MPHIGHHLECEGVPIWAGRMMSEPAPNMGNRPDTKREELWRYCVGHQGDPRNSPLSSEQDLGISGLGARCTLDEGEEPSRLPKWGSN